jgi:hypothetical protein
MALSLSPRRKDVMNPELWVPAVTTIAIVAIIAGSSYRLLKMWLQRSGRLSIPEADLQEIRDRLGQLQQAVDTIAIEVERLSEGQRFTTKLLAEGSKGVAPVPAKDATE